MNVFSQSDIKQSNVLKTQLIQPEPLKSGDTITKAINIFKSWGLNVVLGNHIYDKNGHFAGTDKNREKDFQKALDNKNIKAIWCARGGYGAVRIIDKLNFDNYLKNPKWIIGFSDITVIHNKLNFLNSESIHAMMITGFEDIGQNNDSLSKLKNVLFGDSLSYSITSNKNNKTGKSEGIIVGGNLTLIQSTIGSKTELKMKDKILFIEEIGEYAYHIDRMLYSLKRAGYFENCKGLIVGQISDVKKNTTDFGRSINELILDVLDEYNFPILFDFPAGHEKTNFPIILGRKVILDVSKPDSKVIFYN
jgi:muramoyltetrapeptide carboxypeptidase